MDVEIDYDLQKKRVFKEVKMFLSIAPTKIEPISNKEHGENLENNFVNFENPFHNQIPIFHGPFKNFFTEKTKYIIENKQNFLNFYRKKEETFQEILSNTYIVIAIDKEFSLYGKGIANYVKIIYGEELQSFDSPTEESSENLTEDNENRIFLTNYSLIKKFYEKDLKEVRVYLLPKEKDCELASFFKKLDYIFSSIQNKNLRSEYFSEIMHKYNLRNLEINERFLKIRSEFLKNFNQDNSSEMFKEPIRKETVFPVLNIMVLNYSKLDINTFNHKDEYHVNKIDFKFYESEFIQKFQKNLVNSDISYVAYLDADHIFKNHKEFWQELPFSPRDLINDKSISVNFGKVEKIEELGCGYYNFMDSCSGSLIYSMQFMPLGITTIKLTNNSLLTTTSNKTAFTNDSNIFLPFSNKAVISVFKKFMNVQNFNFTNLAKGKIFSVERPGSFKGKNKFDNKYLWKSEIFEQSTQIDTITQIKSGFLYYHSNFDEDSEKKNDERSLKNSYFYNQLVKINPSLNFDQTKLSQINKIVNEKLKNKSFKFAAFNKILEDKKNFKISLVNLIDETMINLFK